MSLLLIMVLGLDTAGFAHGDISPDATAAIALVVAIIALALYLRARQVF